MANEASIIIPHHIKLKTPRYQIVPKVGQFVLRCGSCGQLNQFGVYIKPEAGTGRVCEVVCTACGKFAKMDDKGRLEQGGNLIPRKGHEQFARED